MGLLSDRDFLKFLKAIIFPAFAEIFCVDVRHSVNVQAVGLHLCFLLTSYLHRTSESKMSPRAFSCLPGHSHTRGHVHTSVHVWPSRFRGILRSSLKSLINITFPSIFCISFFFFTLPVIAAIKVLLNDCN